MPQTKINAAAYRKKYLSTRSKVTVTLNTAFKSGGGLQIIYHCHSVKHKVEPMQINVKPCLAEASKLKLF